MILHRYILRQIGGPTAVALLALNLLFLLVELLRIAADAVGLGLSLLDLGWLSVLFLPGLAVLTVPVAVLVGVMLGLGRMAEDGEIMALHGAGVRPLAISAMPLVVGALAALLAMVISLWITPLAGGELRRLVVDLAKRNVAASLSDGRFFEEIPNMVLLPGKADPDGKEWRGFFLYDRRHAPRHTVLVASGGRLLEGGAPDELRLELTHGQAHLLDWRTRDYTLASFQSAALQLELGRLLEGRTRFLSPTDHLSLGDLEETAADREQSPRLRQLCRAAWQRRFSFPLAAVAFALLGVALALGARSGRWSNLWLAVAATAAYYLLMRGGDALVERGALPAPIAAWLPDVLALALALGLLVRRERSAG